MVCLLTCDGQCRHAASVLLLRRLTAVSAGDVRSFGAAMAPDAPDLLTSRLMAAAATMRKSRRSDSFYRNMCRNFSEPELFVKHPGMSTVALRSELVGPSKLRVNRSLRGFPSGRSAVHANISSLLATCCCSSSRWSKRGHRGVAGCTRLREPQAHWQVRLAFTQTCVHLATTQTNSMKQSVIVAS